jgi:hypothetical protein
MPGLRHYGAIVTAAVLVERGIVAQRVRTAVGMHAETGQQSSHSNLWKVPAYCGSQIDQWAIAPLPKAYAHKMTPLQIMVCNDDHVILYSGMVTCATVTSFASQIRPIII